MSDVALMALLTYADVAKSLRCCVKHVRDAYVRTGKLKAVRLGTRSVRFRPEDVCELVEHLMQAQAKSDR
jgi:excisionase family DNA binding protein